MRRLNDQSQRGQDETCYAPHVRFALAQPKHNRRRHPRHSKRVPSPHDAHSLLAPVSTRRIQGKALSTPQTVLTTPAAGGEAPRAAHLGACFPQSLRCAVAFFIGGDPSATCRVPGAHTSNWVSQTVIPERDAQPLTTSASTCGIAATNWVSQTVVPARGVPPLTASASARGLAVPADVARFAREGRRLDKRAGKGAGPSPGLPCFPHRLCRLSPLAVGPLAGVARATAGTGSGKETEPLTCQASRRPTLK